MQLVVGHGEHTTGGLDSVTWEWVDLYKKGRLELSSAPKAKGNPVLVSTLNRFFFTLSIEVMTITSMPLFFPRINRLDPTISQVNQDDQTQSPTLQLSWSRDWCRSSTWPREGRSIGSGL